MRSYSCGESRFCILWGFDEQNAVLVMCQLHRAWSLPQVLYLAFTKIGVASQKRPIAEGLLLVGWAGPRWWDFHGAICSTSRFEFQTALYPK